MPNTRDLKIDSLSRNRRRELEYFCLQYRDKIEILKELCCPLGAQDLSGMPTGGDVTSSTEAAAINLEAVRDKTMHEIRLIEQAAIYAYPEKYQELLEYVTTKRNKKETLSLDYILEFSERADIFFEKLNIDK